MKTKFTFLSILAVLFIGISIFTISCKKDEVSDYVTYKGKVVYKGTSTPFPDLEVKLTDGNNVAAADKTDEEGKFSVRVDLSTINGNYYFLVGDATCVPKKVEIPGFGEKECNLGVIEVEGPSLPIVRTKPMTDVTAESAVSGGFVDEDGRLDVSARGICYSRSEYPTIEDAHTQDGSGKGEFTSTLKNLEHNVTYYVRAYATNKKGTSYGEQVKFITEAGVPIVTTDTVINITAHTAKCKAHVESDGGYPVVKRGICYSKKPDPTIDDEITEDGSGLGEYTGSLKNLVENTTYYVRAYATNSMATTYGEQIIITTLDGLAVVKTDKTDNITATSVVCYGTVVSDCDIPVTSRGFCYAKTQYPTIDDDHTTTGKGLGSFQTTISKLESDTKYYIRAYATNATETAYGEQLSITTLTGLATLTTTTVSTTAFTITVGGNITDNGGFAISSRGICYSTSNSEPTTSDLFIESGKGNGSFNATIDKLQANTKYYVRAYATNQTGTSYGNVCTITTKDGKATLTTATITNITALTATGGVTVKDAGGANLQSCGICWSTTQNPTISNFKVEGGTQISTYSCNMTDLQANTTYYVRAYATTDVTTAYGNQVSFKTASGLPVLTTTTTTATSKTISSGGNITSDGGYTITKRGVCYSTTNSNPTIADEFVTNGTGIGAYTCTITNLSVSTTYYVRAFATNSIGTSYGSVQVITTDNGLPMVSTTDPGENITSTSIATGGNVTSDGGFIVTARGVVYSTLPYPTLENANSVTSGSGNGYFSANITNVSPIKNTYYIRAYATNSNGTSYGEQLVITPERSEYLSLPTIIYGGYKYHIYKDMGKGDWNTAKQLCEDLTFAGYSDWYLPDEYELVAMIQAKIDGWYFEFASGYATPYYSFYWTSSSHATYTRYYYEVSSSITGSSGLGYGKCNGSYSRGYNGTSIIYRFRAVRRDKLK